MGALGQAPESGDNTYFVLENIKKIYSACKCFYKCQSVGQMERVSECMWRGPDTHRAQGSPFALTALSPQVCNLSVHHSHPQCCENRSPGPLPGFPGSVGLGGA